MNEQFLQEIGLTKTQATVYSTLVKNSPCSPPALSMLIQESRTNTYKVLEQLESLGLVTRDNSVKKIRYWASNPSVLRNLASEQQRKAETLISRLDAVLPEMTQEFYKNSEQAGVQYYQGKDGLEKIYQDQIKAGLPVTFIRSTADTKLFEYEAMRKLRGQFAKSGIERYVFSPDAADVPTNWQETDLPRLIHRTWMSENDYTAPVEWDVYGSKTAIISFGHEVMGMIIESKQIADSLRQIFAMLERGLRAKDGYASLPTKAAIHVTDNNDLA